MCNILQIFLKEFGRGLIILVEVSLKRFYLLESFNQRKIYKKSLQRNCNQLKFISKESTRVKDCEFNHLIVDN